MNLNNNIFREYDIRGIADLDFDGEFPFLLGKAFGTFVVKNKSKNIAVSGDVRLSTNRLKKDFIKGLKETGVNVIDIGVIPTPINYFSNFYLQIDGSVQITGSHNPADYNGFKFTFQKKPFFGKDIQSLYKIMLQKKYVESRGGVTKIDVIDAYIKDIVSRFDINKKIRVLMDCGNAAGCIVAPQIFKKLNIEIEEMYCDVDGSFPNHHPDPTVDSNLDDLIARIKESTFDLGVAYDGDADRVVCVDSNGNIIRSDVLMCLFIKDILKNSNKKIIYDVKCSSIVKNVILAKNGVPIEWKTGHSLIKSKMSLEKAIFGGEMSGHLFFADDYYGYDDAIYVSLRLIQILLKRNQSLLAMVSEIPKYFCTNELRFECEDDNRKFYIMKELEIFFKKKYKCSSIDGVKVFINTGWGLLRASNTQPVIVCRLESKTSEGLDEIKSIFSSKLSEFRGIDFEF